MRKCLQNRAFRILLFRFVRGAAVPKGNGRAIPNYFLSGLSPESLWGEAEAVSEGKVGLAKRSAPFVACCRLCCRCAG